jgi:hypothetical protein
MDHYTERFMEQSVKKNNELNFKLARITEITNLSNISVDVRFNMIREIVNPQ